MTTRLFVALTLLLCLGGDRAVAATRLPWLDNDYDAARRQARTRHLPLLVEVWAPW
jgi:hypothetical protein